MSMQDLGSLGEFLGGIAVIVSLIYLAIQIRQNTHQVAQNTRSIQRESTRATQQDAYQWRAYLVQSPEIADLYRRGMRHPEELEPGEWLRFRMLLDSLFEHWRYAFFTRDDAEPWVPDGRWAIEGTLSEPGGTRYWEAARRRFPNDAFVRHVDAIAREVRSKEAAA